MLQAEQLLSHCSSSFQFPTSEALRSVICHGDQWKTNQSLRVTCSNLVNTSEQWIGDQHCKEERNASQSYF